MPDPTTGSILAILTALRTLPSWILVSLAIAAWIVISVRPFGGVNSEAFRQQWGEWVWIAAIGFSTLAIARLVDTGVQTYRAKRKEAAARRVLHFVPLHRQCWWHLAKQQDDSYVSQIRMDVQVSNTSARPVQIVKVRLSRPKAELLQANASLPIQASPYHSDDHPVPPHGTIRAAVHVLTQGALAAPGKPLRITLAFTDQFGENYTLQSVTIKTNDPPRPVLALSERWREAKSSASRLVWWGRNIEEPRPPVMPWTYDAGSESVGIAESILIEEKRSYTANGRIRGGLGSINTGLQSEPNYGWTMVGKIPQLLWEPGKGTPVTSPNLERLIRVHSALAATERDNLERYLLAQLRKESPFAEVAYFVFLALHRIGRTIDAMTTARKFLVGDKVYAYSNLFGALSAIISHEHYNIDPNLYPMLLDVMTGDEEQDFRLREKINLARLEFLDRSSGHLC
jgi:hypothetical protein